MAHFTLGVYALGRSEATHSSTTSTLRQLKIWGQFSEKTKYASLHGPPIPPGPWPSSLKRCFYIQHAVSLSASKPRASRTSRSDLDMRFSIAFQGIQVKIHKNHQKPWEIHKLMKFQGLRATWHALSLRINVNPHDEVGILHARPQRLNSDHRYTHTHTWHTHKCMLLSIRPSIHPSIYQSIHPATYIILYLPADRPI